MYYEKINILKKSGNGNRGVFLVRFGIKFSLKSITILLLIEHL